MDTITRAALRDHLAQATEALSHANHVPVEHALPFLTEAYDQLGAAVDTLREARAAAYLPPIGRRPGLSTMGRAESLALLAQYRAEDTRLSELITEARKA